jgi:hypothetical protein
MAEPSQPSARALKRPSRRLIFYVLLGLATLLALIFARTEGIPRGFGIERGPSETGHAR